MYNEKLDEPYSHHILEHSVEARSKLKLYARINFGVTALITLTIWAILSIYWGANWKFETGIHNLNGWIIDFDGGIVGATVTQAYLNNTGQKTQIDWYSVPASMFPNGEADITDAIVNEKAWAAVAIHAGATSRLDAAIAAGSGAGYDNQVATAYAAEARNENSYLFFVGPQIKEPLDQAVSAFPMIQAQRLGDSITALLATAPSLVFQPVNYTIANIRPFDIQVGTAIDFVGLIYLLILSFIAVLGNYQARVMVTGLEKRLTFGRLILVRLLVPILMYFWLSLAYSLLSLFFHVPFDRQFGHAGFVIYWMLSWMGMLALGLAVDSLITILTPRFIPFFLVPWIIVNVSVVFFPIEVLPTLFRYGYATPFYNISRAVRCILFRTRNEVGMNFGILFAWIGISFITIPLFTWWVRRKQALERRRREQPAAPESASEVGTA